MISVIAGALVGTGISAALGVAPRTCLVVLGFMALVAGGLNVAGVIQ